MRWLKVIFTIVTVFAVLWFADATGFAQCAMCKEAAAASPAAKKLNIAILYLMAVPYVLVGTFGGLLYCAYRRQKRV